MEEKGKARQALLTRTWPDSLKKWVSIDYFKADFHSHIRITCKAPPRTWNFIFQMNEPSQWDKRLLRRNWGSTFQIGSLLYTFVIFTFLFVGLGSCCIYQASLELRWSTFILSSAGLTGVWHTVYTFRNRIMGWEFKRSYVTSEHLLLHSSN